ncbi:MAG: 3-isopropylmalate dehydratase small subunit [Peptococcaceae bacterium]|jgi:3-isopropylmalate/(R)-2-methylmalate dehydratase small subunit|nr:3-isopropylmalate dehydratase small subunit [Peptococcaceae bacterium]MDH7525585.1 3-isopropylmalate dehydratase small subunit [Peptococcaceae bacterium]
MEEYIIRGRVHKYGDNINTDLISPAQYMELSYADMAAHAMEGVDPDFPKKMRPGDIIVAGKNFGSGSSRETAPIALKHAGVGAVVAEFFARIFYRNAINIGLPVIESTAAAQVNDGDELEIYPLTGIIKNITQNSEYRGSVLPGPILELIEAGGLVRQLEKRTGFKR